MLPRVSTGSNQRRCASPALGPKHPNRARCICQRCASTLPASVRQYHCAISSDRSGGSIDGDLGHRWWPVALYEPMARHTVLAPRRVRMVAFARVCAASAAPEQPSSIIPCSGVVLDRASVITIAPRGLECARCAIPLGCIDAVCPCKTCAADVDWQKHRRRVCLRHNIM